MYDQNKFLPYRDGGNFFRSCLVGQNKHSAHLCTRQEQDSRPAMGAYKSLANLLTCLLSDDEELKARRSSKEIWRG